MCRCPAHDDRTASLSVSDDGEKVLVHCFAGCEQAAVIAALRERGMWGGRGPSKRQECPVRDPTADLGRWLVGSEIWGAAIPIEGTVAEEYLRWRGLIGAIPRALRFGRVGDRPCLVAGIQRGDGQICAVQCTYLAANGRGRYKKIVYGPMRDGAVRLAPAGNVMGLAEGIETGFSAMQRFSIPVWATLGAARLGGIGLPPIIKKLIIYADNGSGVDAAMKAAALYEIPTEILPPPSGFKDWNDATIAQL